MNDAKKAFENMKKNGTPKAIVYRSYIDCCASCADCEEALETFQQFKMDVLGKDKRIRDDTDAVRAFNGVIAAAKNARNVSVAKSIFQELTEDFAYLAPTEITYGAAIGGGKRVSDTGFRICVGIIQSIERGSERSRRHEQIHRFRNLVVFTKIVGGWCVYRIER